MRVEQIFCGWKLESVSVAHEEQIHFLRAKQWRLAVCIACRLDQAANPEACRVAEWFYPELSELDVNIVRESLVRLSQGESSEDGGVDMHGFIDANPALAGYLSPAAHGLYKMMVALEHVEHHPVTLSNGDCFDVAALLEFVQRRFESAGFYAADSAVSRDYTTFSEMVFGAVESGHSIRLSGS